MGVVGPRSRAYNRDGDRDLMAGFMSQATPALELMWDREKSGPRVWAPWRGALVESYLRWADWSLSTLGFPGGGSTR